MFHFFRFRTGFALFLIAAACAPFCVALPAAQAADIIVGGGAASNRVAAFMDIASAAGWGFLSAASVPISIALSAIGLKWARAWGVETDEALRERLETGIRNAVDAAVAGRGIAVASLAPGGATAQAVVADAAAYVGQHLGDTVRGLRGDPGDAAALQQIVAARLPALIRDDARRGSLPPANAI